MGPVSAWPGPSSTTSKRVPLVQQDSSGLVSQPSGSRYELERLQEQLRAAEAREQRAKQQANDARIENEKLARENELLNKEIHDARASQALSLKQSQEALTNITPLRLENDKLKEAIKQWEELVANKDEELEDMNSELEILRVETKRAEENSKNFEKQIEDLSASSSKLNFELQDAKNRVKEMEIANEQLQQQKLGFDSATANFNLKIAKMEDEIKKLERKLRSAESAVPTPSPHTSPPQAHDYGILDIGSSKDHSSYTNSSSNTGLGVKHQEPIEKPKPATATATITGLDESKKKKDVEIKSVKQERESEREKTYGVSEPDQKAEEWEEVKIEFEIDMEEPFGQEYQKDVWYLSAQDRERYKTLFVQSDLKVDGVVDGPTASKFFIKSKLSRQVLGQIWNLIDVDKKGHLTCEQLCAMFHIVVKLKSVDKLNIPEKLPACLHPEFIERLGTMVTKRVKQTRMERKPVAKAKIAKPITPKGNSLPVASDKPNTTPDALADDNWDSFPASESTDAIPKNLGKGKEKEKEKEKEPPKQTTATAGEEEDWANFDF